MAQPFDYTLSSPNIGDSFFQGIEIGEVFRKRREDREAQERAAQIEAQHSADLNNYLSNPTAEGAAAMIAKYPGQRKAYLDSWNLNNQAQKDSLFNDGTQAYNAIQSGRPEIAEKIINDRISALEASGQDASSFIAIRDSIRSNPKAAQASIGMTLAGVEPDKWGKIAGEMRAAEQAPFELSEKQSKAAKSAVDAKFAESKAVQDLQKGGWEIQKLANDIDISRQNAQIAALNANINRETNDLKRQELQLKLEDKQAKRDQDLRSRVAAVETSRSVIDNSLSTIDNILKNPALNDVLGAVEGSKFYPSTLVGLVPGTASADERQNALADIDTLKSQTFMTQLQQLKEASATGASGLGGVTEKEVDLLINGVQSLNTKQGEEKFKKNLQRMQELLLNGRSRLSEKYGVPDVIPDRPNLESQPASSGFRVLGVE